MDEKYQIYSIDPELITGEQVEDGMLRKDWYLHPALGKCLFKEAVRIQVLEAIFRGTFISLNSCK